MALPVSSLWSGERRMEADNYLDGGYGLRLALEARLAGHGWLSDAARVWQPHRLKGIQVSKEFGTPFLAATQAFDLLPAARKFLSLNRTEDSANRFVGSGTILVTCSGSVGRATLATSALSGILVSHDLLRVEPKNSDLWGWTYAYLRSKTVRSIMTSARYGHIIKHLEPSHLEALPMPTPCDMVAARLQIEVSQVLRSRNEAVEMIRAAESLFETIVGLPKLGDTGEAGFSVRASELAFGRRRLEGVFHNPTVRDLQSHFRKRKLKTESLVEAGFELWLPNRFRRIPAEEGVELVGSADLFEINPDLTKRIADGEFGDRSSGRAKPGWLLLARSGQTYGLNGTLAIANAFHEDKVISDHVIRIAPKTDCSARAGYMYAALSHPILGRPMVKSLAYGSSIPEIDVSDIARLPIPRLDKESEGRIADMSEEGARLFAEADLLENRISTDVDTMLSELLSGSWTNFVPFSGNA